ncbi:MAG: ATP-binding protein [Pseudomonadota bacterium]
MITGLSLPGRVGLILVVAFFAVMVTAMAVVYVTTDVGRTAQVPTPERLSALARLIERAGPDERDTLLAAVNAPGLAVSVLPVPLTRTTMPDLWPFEAATLATYADLVVERHVVVTPLEIDNRPRHLFASAFNEIEFRLALDTDETLVVQSQSPFTVSLAGLPVGFGAGVIGMIIALVTLILLHREFRPLTRLAAALEAVDPTTGPVELPPIRARSPEIRALVAAFQRLQARLATLIHARMALVGGIQHDVRTFATRLRLRIDKIADPTDRARAEADINDMIALLDDALVASRAGASELDEELVDLAALVAAEVADRAAATLAPGAGACEATVLGDRLALRRIVANLVDNAIRYGHRARLDLGIRAGEIVLTVDDEGPGIPPADRALLLEPFTRTEASRARRTGGAGLGLAVVRSLAEAHGGSVAITDAPGGGARLTVTLPRFALGLAEA